jgi:hypothetical protein
MKRIPAILCCLALKINRSTPPVEVENDVIRYVNNTMTGTANGTTKDREGFIEIDTLKNEIRSYNPIYRIRGSL